MHVIRTSTIYIVALEKKPIAKLLKKLCCISLKPTNEITFLCQIKVSINHYKILSVRDLLSVCDVTNYMYV